MDLTNDPNGMGMEIAQIMAATPEWQRAKEELRAVLRPDMKQEDALAVCSRALAEVGLGSEVMLAKIPETYAPLLTPEVRASFAQLLDLYMFASVLSDLEGSGPLPLVSIARGGVRVEEHKSGDAVLKVVHAMVTPFDNPEQIIAEFAEACYRTYDSSAFSHRTTNVRDAEWWRRHEQDETYRTIALHDSRSGLAPEARIAPAEYADEVLRATDRVRRAVRRFTSRWTRNADLMSKGAR